jgi:hypothetical protein
MTETITINDFRPEIRSLLRNAKAAGFTIDTACNGEDKVRHPDVETAVKCLNATDEGHVILLKPVATPTGMQTLRWTVFLVLGNDPGELVSDWSYPRNFDADGKVDPFDVVAGRRRAF